VSWWFFKIHKPGSQKPKNGVSYITIILQKSGKLGAELENLCNRNYPSICVHDHKKSQGTDKKRQLLTRQADAT
jgi:hypothetical protein